MKGGDLRAVVHLALCGEDHAPGRPRIQPRAWRPRRRVAGSRPPLQMGTPGRTGSWAVTGPMFDRLEQDVVAAVAAHAGASRASVTARRVRAFGVYSLPREGLSAERTHSGKC